MSIEQSVIRRAQPQMVAQRLAAVLSTEITKGCSPDLGSEPCRLEPKYYALFAEPSSDQLDQRVLEEPIAPSKLKRLRVWISPNQNRDWNRSELFLKHLSRLTHRVGFEISGNRDNIQLGFLVQVDDAPVVETAFRSLFDESEVSNDPNSPFRHLADRHLANIRFCDFYPPPPYSHLLTSYEELKSTPFAGLIQPLAQIVPPSVGFYQCLFQPVQPGNDWHHNVEMLLDLEYELKLHRTFNLSRQYLQQAPSGDLHQMSRELDTKAHNDRPFFFAAVRVGLYGATRSSASDLVALAAFINLFQHGGRPLNYLTDADYEKVCSRQALPLLFHRGITLQPGFLVNSRELTGLVHIFHTRLLESRRIPLKPLETLPVRDPALLAGTCIGTCEFAGVTQEVCIPPSIRSLSTHIMSSPGMGKSTLLLNIFLQDIVGGKGALFIDVHGDAVKQALRLIPPSLYPKCIYFAPGDSEWIPVWNPLSLAAGCDRYRRADAIVGSLRRIVTDWGDRVEHVARNGLIGLSYLPRTSLLDLYCLVRQGSPESEELRKQIVRAAIDEPVRKFWQTDFLKDYRKSDLQAPKHKLSKLVSAGDVSLMLSQPDSRIDFRTLMDQGWIMLVDLSFVGGDLADTLGAFILSLLFSTALSRSDTDESQRKPFAILADEAHRFVAAEAIEDILIQGRKFHLDLSLANQFLSQWAPHQIDALSTAGCTILGRIDKRDGQYFSKDMQDLVSPKDIFRLDRYEMIARIGKEVVRFKTHKLPPEPPGGDWQHIVQASRRKYCRKADDIRAELARRSERWYQPSVPLTDDVEEWPFTKEDLAYDEF
jgi:hypothetical protein